MERETGTGTGNGRKDGTGIDGNGKKEAGEILVAAVEALMKRWDEECGSIHAQLDPIAEGIAHLYGLDVKDLIRNAKERYPDLGKRYVKLI